MAIEKNMLCPMRGSECIEDGAIVDGVLCGCRFWITVIGKDPTTGADVNKADCSFAWTPILLIENSQMQRQTGAAVESFRNEMVASNEISQKVLLAAAQSQGLLINKY
jgi:hypothetical protein